MNKYIIKVDTNPDYCGVGAFGLHFANGSTKTTSERFAKWFQEHEGYTVECVNEEIPCVSDQSGDICIDNMTVPQLKSFVKENGIDIGSASKKEDIIKAIIAAGESDAEV